MEGIPKICSRSLQRLEMKNEPRILLNILSLKKKLSFESMKKKELFFSGSDRVEPTILNTFQ